MRSRLITSTVAIVLAGGALALTGCGAAESALSTADTQAGKTLFVTSCGGCHTMTDAGTTGVVGPNLDDAFSSSRQQGFQDSIFYGIVKRWIAMAPQPPLPGSYPQAMPQNLVIGTDAENVAAYVATFAGTSPGSDVRAITPAVQGTPASPAKDPATALGGGATSP